MLASIKAFTATIKGLDRVEKKSSRKGVNGGQKPSYKFSTTVERFERSLHGYVA
jgi:hypothetical protein